MWLEILRLTHGFKLRKIAPMPTPKPIIKKVQLKSLKSFPKKRKAAHGTTTTQKFTKAASSIQMVFKGNSF